jgi:hypothetical protein
VSAYSHCARATFGSLKSTVSVDSTDMVASQRAAVPGQSSKGSMPIPDHLENPQVLARTQLGGLPDASAKDGTRHRRRHGARQRTRYRPHHSARGRGVDSVAASPEVAEGRHRDRKEARKILCQPKAAEVQADMPLPPTQIVSTEPTCSWKVPLLFSIDKEFTGNYKALIALPRPACAGAVLHRCPGAPRELWRESPVHTSRVHANNHWFIMTVCWGCETTGCRLVP